MSTAEKRKGGYTGGKHRIKAFAQRLVEIGVEVLSTENAKELTPAQSQVLMRQIASRVCDEFGGLRIHIQQELEFDGLTARDRAIWEAYDGTNKAELALRFDLSERMVEYVIAHCYRMTRRLQQPELPGLQSEGTEP